MQRFKNILVCYSQRIGDESALNRATTLAKANGARLTLIEVIERLPDHAGAPLGSSFVEERDLERRFIDERQALLDRLVTSIRQDGVEASASIRRGPTFLEIIRAVLRDGYDLVVLTADSWRGLRWITFGSTSMHLMRKCPCPVWVINPKAGPHFGRILAAVNPNLSDTSPAALDLKILQMASSLARMEDCHLDILNAWSFSGGDRDTIQSEITGDARSRLVQKNRSAHKAALDSLLETIDLDGVRFETHLPEGNPSLVIPQFVQEQKVDLIVMGTVTRTGIAGFIIGATAEDVLRQVDCSVLTVKPDGFVTPVAISDRE